MGAVRRLRNVEASSIRPCQRQIFSTGLRASAPSPARKKSRPRRAITPTPHAPTGPTPAHGAPAPARPASIPSSYLIDFTNLSHTEQSAPGPGAPHARGHPVVASRLPGWRSDAAATCRIDIHPLPITRKSMSTDAASLRPGMAFPLLLPASSSPKKEHAMHDPVDLSGLPDELTTTAPPLRPIATRAQGRPAQICATCGAWRTAGEAGRLGADPQ